MLLLKVSCGLQQTLMPIVRKVVRSLILGGLVLCLTVILSLSTIGVITEAIAQPNPTALARLVEIKEKFGRLEEYVVAQNWTTIKTYIHGPFGGVRQDIRLATAGLSPKERAVAKTLTKEFVGDLVKIDFAASDRDIDSTEAAFDRAKQDFEQLVALIENS
jgi:photosystem II protein PsbQ